MAKAYSLDFRDKIQQASNEGLSAKNIARNFRIGIATVYRFVKLYKSGIIGPKKRSNYHTKIPINKIGEYVEKNPDHTLKEIGDFFSIVPSTVHQYLRKLDITYKKNETL